jgi:hypothetical protein
MNENDTSPGLPALPALPMPEDIPTTSSGPQAEVMQEEEATFEDQVTFIAEQVAKQVVADAKAEIKAEVLTQVKVAVQAEFQALELSLRSKNDSAGADTEEIRVDELPKPPSALKEKTKAAAKKTGGFLWRWKLAWMLVLAVLVGLGIARFFMFPPSPAVRPPVAALVQPVSPQPAVQQQNQQKAVPAATKQKPAKNWWDDVR